MAAAKMLVLVLCVGSLDPPPRGLDFRAYSADFLISSRCCAMMSRSRSSKVFVVFDHFLLQLFIALRSKISYELQ